MTTVPLRNEVSSLPYKDPYRGYSSAEDPRPVGRPIQPRRIPILGSINEPALEAEGWRIVRDPDTGYALYEEEIDGER